MAKVFNTTVKKRKRVIIQGGDGDRDVSFVESIAISDALSGTLGPVQTPDSIDISDEFVARTLVLQDSLDVADDLGQISGLVLDDSIDVSDSLAGTLGPIRAPDTFDATDDPVFGPLVLQDSLDAHDAAEAVLSATATDSIDISDRLGQIIRFDQEEFFAADALGEIQRVQVAESFDAADSLGEISGLQVLDTLNASDAAEATLSARIPDSLDATDLARFGPLEFYDTLDVSDSRGNANVTNARLWPNALVSNSTFTTPANAHDTSETTAAVLSISQSGGLLFGSSQTANGTIVVSCPDINVVPTPSLTNVQIQAGWTTTASGGLQTGNSVNGSLEYSLNDGASWSPIVANITTVSGTGNPTLNITATYAQLNQLRFRSVATVVSGTTLVVGGANQQWQVRYFRVQFDAQQVL